MIAGLAGECGELGRLALSLSPGSAQDIFAVTLALDERLARIVGSVSEPMLGQLRLAWWRDRLSEPVESRPRGDVVLDAAEAWDGHETGLIALVDGWEAVLVENDASSKAAGLANGRAAAFAEIARMTGNANHSGAAERHGSAWAFATIAAVSQEKQDLLSAYRDRGTPIPPLPRTLRPLALIGRLSDRALRRGGAAILGDRLSPLVAARIGFLGR